MILALVCGGAALLALMSLATMIPLDIGVLPKGKWPKKWSRYILTVIIFYDDLIGYERIASDTEDDSTHEIITNPSVSVMAWKPFLWLAASFMQPFILSNQSVWWQTGFGSPGVFLFQSAQIERLYIFSIVLCLSVSTPTFHHSQKIDAVNCVCEVAVIRIVGDQIISFCAYLVVLKYKICSVVDSLNS